MKRSLTGAAIAAAALAAPAIAVEGMWTPGQVEELAPALRSLGYDGDPKALSDLKGYPLGAVVSLGGCTASFVSPDGLVATNHHCAYGSIQFNSKPEANLLANGFIAADKASELKAAPGSRVYALVETRDVTPEVVGWIPSKLDPRKRYQAIDDRKKGLVAECEKDPGHRCTVDAFHGGASYVLRKNLEIRDVRLVYAPSERIGKYGGDVDNWIWPRHTGDFAFYRAYVGPDGKPADYAEANVPFKPAHHLKIAKTGVRESDFVMIAGYPGRTYRYQRLSQVENAFAWSYPTRRRYFGEIIETIEKAAPEGSDARIKYASMLAGLNNVTKNYDGQMEGAARVGLVSRRKEREAALDAWIAADAKRKAKFAAPIAQLDALVAEQQAKREQDLRYGGAASRPALLSAAKRLYRLAKEKTKPDAEREPGYQERDVAFIRNSLQAIERRYDPAVDKAVWLMLLKWYQELPASERVAAFDKALGMEGGADEATLSATLDRFYAETKLGDTAARLALMDASAAELASSADPFMQLAVAIYDFDMKTEEDEKTRAGRLSRLQPLYMDAIIAWNKAEGRLVYPDANSTLRITVGRVMGGSPRDGLLYAPFTTLEGVLAKHSGADPFNSPDKQNALIRAKDHGPYALDAIGSVPVNFLSDHDITGGNSGSPVMNAKGELVGLAFDGTYESINSDWDFDPRTTRTISVDARYMLWVLDKVDGAHGLLAELGFEPSRSE